ncbi:RDD family protein [Chitinophaga sp.]|uniref:RDD family protein n=1 Tax=Chitinophaga sp. TaxID=1869181 RepID=UPI0031DC2931
MKETSPHLLEEFDQELALTPVSKGTRFANSLLDNIGYYIIYYLVYAMWREPVEPGVWLDRLWQDTLMSFAIYFGYYVVFESALKGRTPGKLITGTVAVKTDGSALTFNDVVIRSLTRLIPIEPLSIFWGELWHDKFADSTVIRKIK